MFDWFNRLRKNERGTIIVLFAGALTLLLFFCAFVIDFGLLYFHRRNLQNAADSAALAGVWDISNAETEARSYAEKHNVTYGVQVNADNQRVHVVIENNYPRFFGIVFGRENYKVAAEAVAGTAVGWDKFMPFTPLPKNYIDDVWCPDETSLGPFLEEDDFGELQGRRIEDLTTGTSHTYTFQDGTSKTYGYDAYEDYEERLEDFKNRIKLNVKLGVIAGTQGSETQSFGWLTLPGDDKVAKPRTLARWIIDGYDSDDPEGTITIEMTSRPGAIQTLFNGNEHNITGEQISAIDYLIEYNQPFYVILPHPSIPFDEETFTTIERNNYLIAKCTVPWDKIGCEDNPSDKYRLIAIIEEVYNPLNSVDLQKLQVAGVRVTIPFLIR